MKNSEQITCPNCGEEISIEEALKHQVEDQLAKQYKNKLKELEKQLSEKDEQQKSVIESERKKIYEKAQQEQSVEFKALQQQLLEQDKKLGEAREQELEFRRKQRELDSKEKELDIEVEKRVQKEITNSEEEITKRIQEQNDLKIREHEKKLEDMQKALEIAKRKGEQGSMQLQGEIQELALEELLEETFKYDLIEEVPKGVNGADCIQTVNNDLGKSCGSIIYESKRTKNFGSDWIGKLKDDQRKTGSDIAVLVTQTMPKEMDSFGQRDGVWICTFNQVKGLALVLRQSIIDINNLMSTQENKGDKMTLLYNYISSNEFKRQLESIIDGFSGMKEQLEKEKRAMASQWKTREKLLDKVIDNTVDMYGSIRGIAGNKMLEVKALELEPGE